MESLKEISLSNIEKKGGDVKSYSYNLMNDEAKKVHEQSKLNQTQQELIEQKEQKNSNNPDEEAIEQMWDSIEQEIESGWQTYFQPNKTVALSKQKKIAKSIRVFVSSTFTDFFNEREVLVKKVFPVLREWCYERNMDLIECDLRWGVPNDSSSDQTILTCLNELDRCYKDNDGQPFFIGMLGEKYGWVPEMSKLATEIQDKYKWIPKISITFMEILHGVLRSRNKNAFFFMRSSDSLEGIPTEYKEKFYEADSYSKLQLKILKEKLKKLHPLQVAEYDCKYDGIDESTGRKKVKLTGYDEFAKQALEFLFLSIQNTYPFLKETVISNDNFDIRKVCEKESSYQAAYLNEKLSFHIPRHDETQAILDFIHKKDSDLIKPYCNILRP